jgi:hypothetical protein
MRLLPFLSGFVLCLLSGLALRRMRRINRTMRAGLLENGISEPMTYRQTVTAPIFWLLVFLLGMSFIIEAWIK